MAMMLDGMSWLGLVRESDLPFILMLYGLFEQQHPGRNVVNVVPRVWLVVCGAMVRTILHNAVCKSLGNPRGPAGVAQAYGIPGTHRHTGCKLEWCILRIAGLQCCTAEQRM